MLAALAAASATMGGKELVSTGATLYIFPANLDMFIVKLLAVKP